MQDLVKETQELKKLIQQLLHQQETTPTQPWSKEKVDAMAVRYQQIKNLREEWVSDHDLHKHLPGGWHGTGAFIRQELEFINCIKDGYYFMYYKPDPVSLKNALKEKNINLSRYMELKSSEVDFERMIKKLEEQKKKEPGRKPF